MQSKKWEEYIINKWESYFFELKPRIPEEIVTNLKSSINNYIKNYTNPIDPEKNFSIILEELKIFLFNSKIWKEMSWACSWTTYGTNAKKSEKWNKFEIQINKNEIAWFNNWLKLTISTLDNLISSYSDKILLYIKITESIYHINKGIDKINIKLKSEKNAPLLREINNIYEAYIEIIGNIQENKEIKADLTKRYKKEIEDKMKKLKNEYNNQDHISIIKWFTKVFENLKNPKGLNAFNKKSERTNSKDMVIYINELMQRVENCKNNKIINSKYYDDVKIKLTNIKNNIEKVLENLKYKMYKKWEISLCTIVSKIYFLKKNSIIKKITYL